MIKIYHGDNHNTNKLSPKLMNSGNNQEGIGIYFGDLETAQFYGNNIVNIEINENNFVNSRGLVKSELSKKDVYKLYLALWKVDEEVIYYAVTDWGMAVLEPEDIMEEHVLLLADYNMTEEVRNLQIDLAEKFGVENFVKAWNKAFPNVHGTYNKRENFWCVINTKYKVTKVK